MVNTLTKNSSNWYLIYTNPRAEKKVAEGLKHKGMEFFLPLHKTLRQWSDRKKWVEEPLFKSYIFVNFEFEKNYAQVMSVAGAAKLVSFNGKPAVVDPREIDLVKRLLGSVSQVSVSVADFATFSEVEGAEVDIIAGPLLGCKGRILDKLGKQQVLIELKSMQQTLCVSMPFSYLKLHTLITQTNI